jgi:hypothetical protein
VLVPAPPREERIKALENELGEVQHDLDCVRMQIGELRDQEQFLIGRMDNLEGALEAYRDDPNDKSNI